MSFIQLDRCSRLFSLFKTKGSPWSKSLINMRWRLGSGQSRVVWSKLKQLKHSDYLAEQASLTNGCYQLWNWSYQKVKQWLEVLCIWMCNLITFWTSDGCKVIYAQMLLNDPVRFICLAVSRLVNVFIENISYLHNMSWPS